MGYNTTLIFVDTYNRKTRYRRIVGTCKLNKLPYKVGSIFQKLLQQKDNEQLETLIEKFNILHKKIYNSEGDYNEFDEFGEIIKEEDKKKLIKKYDIIFEKLEKKLPFIYYSNNNLEDFKDDYGTLLMERNLEDVEKALMELKVQDYKENNKEYYAYNMALDMIKTLKKMNNPKLKNQRFRVILWGN